MADNTEEKKIRFTAEGNGLLNFFKQAQSEFQKFQKEGKSIVDTFAQMAKESGAVGKDQYRFIQDSLKGLKEQLKLQKEITKEKQAANKLAQEANQENNAITASVRNERAKKLKDEEDRLNQQFKSYSDRGSAVNQAGTINQRNRQDYSPDKRSFFNDLIRSNIFQDLLGTMKQTVSASTGLDLLPGMAGIAGAVTGGLAGAAIDALNVKVLGTGAGDIHASTVLSALGKDISSTAAQGAVRHLREEDRYLGAAYGVRGLTGRSSQAGDLSRYGLDMASSAELEQRIIRSTGTAASASQIGNVAAIGKFGNIDQNIIMSLLKTSRMGGTQNERSIIDMFAAGMNRSNLNEGTQKLVSILETQGGNRITLDEGEALRRISLGERLGGPFSASDSRSSGLEAQYMTKLADPQGGFAQAVSFAALKQLHPDANLLELKKFQQEGGVDYENAVKGIFGNMTGNKVFNTLSYGANFGTGIAAFDERRFNGDFSNLAAGMGGNNLANVRGRNILEEGGDLTTRLSRETAETTNAFVKGFLPGIEAVATQFQNRILDMINSYVDKEISKAKDGVGRNGETDVIEQKLRFEVAMLKFKENQKLREKN